MSGGPIIPVPSPPTILISDSDPTEYHRKHGNRRLRILAVQTRHARTRSQFESGTTGTRRSLITSRIHREREHIRFQAERRRPSHLHASSSTVPYVPCNSTYKVRSVQMRHLRTYWKHVTDYERPRGRRVVRTLDRSAQDLPLVSGTSIRPHRAVNTGTTSNNDTIRSRIVSPSVYTTCAPATERPENELACRDEANDRPKAMAGAGRAAIGAHPAAPPRSPSRRSR